jgi:hypothetical protein
MGFLGVEPAMFSGAWKTPSAPRATRGQTPSSSGSVSPACRAHLDPSRRRCSRHAPTSLRPRRIAQLGLLCRTSARSKGDPNRCAIAAYHGSWERPDNGFADIVLGTAAKGDAPDFEMPEGTGNDTGEVNPTSRNTTPATAPPETLDDDEPARQSALFPVTAKPSDSSPERAFRKRPDCRRRREKRRSNGPSDSHSTACRQRVRAAFCTAICAEIAMTKRRRGVDECAGLEAVGYRPHYGKIKAAVPRVAKPLTWLSFPRGVGRSAVPLEGKKLDFSRLFSAPAIQKYLRDPWAATTTNSRS